MRSGQRQGTRRKLRHAIAALLLGTGIAAGVGEVIVRMVPHMKVSTVMWASHPTLGAIQKPNQQARFSDREFNNRVLTNSAGQHDYERLRDKPEGVYRILVLGDSYVEGLHVSRDSLFSNRLCDLLNGDNRCTRRYEVISLARSGWGTAQELKALEDIGLAYAPDLVVLCFLPDNDFFNSCADLMGDACLPYYEVNEEGDLELIVARRDLSRDRLIYRICKRSQLICCLKQNLGSFRRRLAAGREAPVQFGIYEATKSTQWEAAIQTTLACVGQMQQVCAGRGIELLCLGVTTRYLVEQMDIARYHELYPTMADRAYDFEGPYEILKTYLTARGIDYVSLLEPFQADFAATRRPSHYAVDGHWNAYGHALAADVLHVFLQSHPELLARGR